MFDQETVRSIAGFRSTRIPFDDSSAREEMKNIDGIAAKLENDHATLVAELKAI